MCVCVCVCVLASLYSVVYIYVCVCVCARFFIYSSIYIYVCVCAHAGLRAYVEHTAWASVLFSFTIFKKKSKFKKGPGKTQTTHKHKNEAVKEKLQISNDIYPPICNGHVSKRFISFIIKIKTELVCMPSWTRHSDADSSQMRATVSKATAGASGKMMRN